MSEDPKPQRCPNCGRDAVTTKVYWVGRIHYKTVCCNPVCILTGPMAELPKRATAAWNRIRVEEEK